MTAYKERPNLFDAFEFTGGKKNAKELMLWLKKFELAGAWSPALRLKNDEGVVVETTRESFTIMNHGRADRLYVGTVVFFDRRDRCMDYKLMYAIDFHAKYEAHEEDK